MAQHQLPKSSIYLDQNPEAGVTSFDKNFDDDGREKRTGTWVTACAHIITGVIGSGILSLAWAIAQLGWVVGPVILVAFSFITYFTASLLVDCYRAPDRITGKRNYTYMDAVKTHLGGRSFKLCGLAQYSNLVGISIGSTITASISMIAVQRSNCFHKHGHQAECNPSPYPYMIVFAVIQVVLSQIPNFHKLSWLSVLAAVMSFAYAIIGIGLSIVKVAGDGQARTTLTGVTVGVDVSGREKILRTVQAIGDIAFAYAYSTILIEIEDTLRSNPPENKEMKKATLVGIVTTSLFYILCGCIGYAAFGNDAPGNFLTGFGFYEPFWLIDFANVCIAIHLIGAYQVFSQPVYGFVETWCSKKWTESKFITREHIINLPLINKEYSLNYFRLVWRTGYVIVTAVIAMIFPFFNDFLGLLGAASFWPLTVYFPVEMYIAKTKLPKFSFTWIWLKILSWACLVISISAAVGSLQGLAHDVKTYKPFKTIH